MKKPKERLEQKLEIPERLLDQLKDGHNSSEFSSISKQLLTTTELRDVNKQATSLKKALDEWKKLLPDAISRDTNASFIEVLCYIFMDCIAKNPCRRSIASFFQSLNVCGQERALEYLSKVMVDILMNLTGGNAEKNVEDVNFRKHVDTVCSLLENFAIGEKCVSLEVIQVLEFLVMALEYHVVRESLVGTPALQTAAMLDCLVTIKATMNVLQKCKEKIADSLNKVDKTTSLLQRFARVVVDVLKNDTFFPDCRSAAGMALALVIRTCVENDDAVQIVVSLFFPSYMKIPHSADEDGATHWISSTFSHQDFADLSGFSYLNVCHGVITMFARDSLVANRKFLCGAEDGQPGNLLLDVLFSEITSICLSLKDSSTLAAMRTLAYWSAETRESMLDTKGVEDCFRSRMHGNSEIIQRLLNFVWNFWDHPLEAMKYFTREMFDNAVKIHITCTGNEPTSDPFVADLARKLCEIDMFVRGKYGPLCCLVNILGAGAMLKIHPRIPGDIMLVMTDQTVVPHAMEFAEKMFMSHLQEISKTSSEYLNELFELWVLPALRGLSLCEKPVKKHIVEYYVPMLLKCCPESLHCIIQKLHMPEKSFEGEFALDTVRCLVACLKTARHLGLLPKTDIFGQENADTNGLWLGSISFAVLDEALRHIEDEVRSDVLGLICDSVRTTEPFTASDLDLLKTFYPVNMNSQSASFRQCVLAMTKKLFIRLRDGGRSWKRKLCDKNCVGSDVLAAHVKHYTAFIEWFVKLQFQSLFPGASFARKTTALQNLNLLLQVFPDNEEKDPYAMFDGCKIFTSQSVLILLDCLKDTYDINKQTAFNLLVGCPPSIHPFQDVNFTLQWTTTATQYAISPKAINVSTAARMFKILIQKSPHEICLPTTSVYSEAEYPQNNDQSNDGVASLVTQAYQLDLDNKGGTSIPCVKAFRLIYQLVNVLKCQIKVARKSLLQAAFDAPIHGLLYCIREVMYDLDMSDVAGNNEWQLLVSAILQVCYDVTDVVSPVVTNSSPEGNVCDNGGNENNEEFDHIAPKAQILLVCCWRAMKEVSLLLGEITKNSPVKKDESFGLLSFEQFEEIGQLFTNMLLTSKHRGAYELAHDGFVKLCHMLWRCDERQIQRLPEVFLTRLLSDISSDDPTPWLCGTRRSAGLPFFFKAIVTTEPNTTGKCCFKSVMKELLKTAAKAVNKQNTNKDTTLPQVHARNILRALYKETKLGEDVFPYVADGVQIAVEGFLSEIWAVRNSSTLLFSALMNRIFGPQSFQDEKRRQGMTGREFFSRFPSLHAFLILQLDISLKDSESGTIPSFHLHPSLYPVLLLLSRLSPSAMDGNDSTLNMAAFIPYVLRCSKSCVFKTRAMAARALVPLVSGVTLQDMLKSLVGCLPLSCNERIEQNQVHGCLLQIQELLHYASTNVVLSNRAKNDIYTSIVPLLLKRVWLASRFNTCGLSRAVFLSIVRLHVVDQTWYSQSHSEILSELSPVIETAIEEITTNEYSTNGQAFRTGLTLVKEEIARITFHPIFGLSSSNVLTAENVSRIKAFLFMTDYEVNLIALEFLHRFFKTPKDWSMATKNVEEIVRELLRHMWNSKMKGECLAMLYKCLSLAPQLMSFPWQLDGQRNIQFSEVWRHVAHSFYTINQRSSVVCSLLHFSSVLVKEFYEENLNEDSGKMIEEWVSFIETCADSYENEILRLTLSQVIGSGNVTFVLVEPLLGFENLTFRLWKVIINLLLDDSVEVKHSMATGLSKVLQSIAQGCSTNYDVHSFLALEQAVRTPLELFWFKYTSLTLHWLVDLLQNTQSDVSVEASQGAAYEDMRNIDKLFEKGPANTHREACILAEVVFKEFYTWMNKNDDNATTQVTPGLFDQLGNFVTNQVTNCNRNFTLESIYYGLYITILALAMIKVLAGKTKLNDGRECEKDRIHSIIFANPLDWVQQIQKLDTKQCFYHFKLEELTNFVLGENVTI